MEAVHIFNSTVLVLWCVGFVPYALKNRHYALLMMSICALFMVEVRMSWHIHDYPFNVLASIAVMLTSFSGGLVMHYFNEKLRGKNK